jgi:hypothetical protein
MIISASRRTDIPALYSAWFLSRLKAGYVAVKNPWYPGRSKLVDLSPGAVDCIAFWTKDPFNMIDKLETIDKMGHRYFFLFTVTGYGRELEKGLRDKEEIIKTFRDLAGMIGKDKVIWRYDPIILNENHDAGYHAMKFGMLCEKLSGYTEKCIISFADKYPNIKKGIVRPIEKDEMLEISSVILETAGRAGISIDACCEDPAAMAPGTGREGCIGRSIIERLCGPGMDIRKDVNQRKGCGCVSSTDIGAYNTCINGCLYCYAVRSIKAAEENFARHDPNSESLI